MTQAFLPVLSSLPQLDPLAAALMRPETAADDFSGIAALFGLQGAPGSSGLAPENQPEFPLAAAADGGELAGEGHQRESGAARQEAQPELLLQLLDGLRFDQPASGLALDGQAADAAVLRADATQAGADITSTARNGHFERQTALLTGLSGSALVGKSLDEAPEVSLLMMAAESAGQKLVSGLPAATGLEDSKLANQSGRDRIAALTGRHAAATAEAMSSTGPGSPAGDETLDSLTKLVHEQPASKPDESLTREAGRVLLDQLARPADSARTTHAADSSLMARGELAGLQPGSTPAQTALNGALPMPAPQASAAAHQTFDHVALMLRQGSSEARLQLKPPELGQVDIRIEVDGKEARVHLTAQQAQTREALEQLLPRLRESLAGQGVELSEAHVDHSGGQFSGQRDEAPGDGEASSHDSHSAHSSGTAAEADEGPSVAQMGLRGLVDLYA